jgi:hypothetical protein
MSRELSVAYFRVGVGRQGRSQMGLEVQHRAVADYLDDGERELVGEYTEIEAGPGCDRPQLARALQVCRRQKATLLIARLDRLARDASVLFDIFDSAADCEVVFCDLPQLAPTRVRKFLITQLGDRAAGSGRGWGNPPALEQDDAAGRRPYAIARRLADQRAANTLPIVRELQASGIGTLQGMADALNARGIPTARGAR